MKLLCLFSAPKNTFWVIYAGFLPLNFDYFLIINPVIWFYVVWKDYWVLLEKLIAIRVYYVIWKTVSDVRDTSSYINILYIHCVMEFYCLRACRFNTLNCFRRIPRHFPNCSGFLVTIASWIINGYFYSQPLYYFTLDKDYLKCSWPQISKVQTSKGRLSG